MLALSEDTSWMELPIPATEIFRLTLRMGKEADTGETEPTAAEEPTPKPDSIRSEYGSSFSGGRRVVGLGFSRDFVRNCSASGPARIRIGRRVSRL